MFTSESKTYSGDELKESLRRIKTICHMLLHPIFDTHQEVQNQFVWYSSISQLLTKRSPSKRRPQIEMHQILESHHP